MAGHSLALLAVLCSARPCRSTASARPSSGLGAADPGRLWVAALAFAARVCAARSPGARRSAQAERGRRRRVARYAVGYGLNAIAPAHLGSAVRVALFGRVTTAAVDGRRRSRCRRRHTRRLARRADRGRQRGRRSAPLAAARDRRDRRRRSRCGERLAAGQAAAAARTGARRVQMGRRLAARPRDRRRLGARRAPPPSSPRLRPSPPRSGSSSRCRAALDRRAGGRARRGAATHARQRRRRERRRRARARDAGRRSATALSAGIAFGAVELLAGMAVGRPVRSRSQGPRVRP